MVLEAENSINRLLIVDDHPLVRLGVRRLLESQHDLEVCGEAKSFIDARMAIRDLAPDVVMMEINLKDGDGLNLVRNIRERHPSLPILIFSLHDEAIYAERMLSAGASGYITKDAHPDQLLAALRCVLSGKIYATELASSYQFRRVAQSGLLCSADPIDRLSNRELQVLRMVGGGLSTREISNTLILSVKTVESHRQRLKRKLHLTSGAQLVQYAVRWATGTARAAAISTMRSKPADTATTATNDLQGQWTT